MKNKKINKVGATYGGWLEVILFTILFVGIFVIIGTSMNSSYSKNHDLTFGIVTEDMQQDMEDLGTIFSNSTQSEGQTSMSSFGILMLSTLPKMITSISSILWSFVTGSFINSIIGLLNLGDFSGIVITIIKLLYFFSLGLILLKILTKVII